MLRHVLLSMHLHLLQVLDGPRSLSRTGTSRRPRPCPCDRICLASRDLVVGVRSDVLNGIIPYRRAFIALLSRESRTRRRAGPPGVPCGAPEARVRSGRPHRTTLAGGASVRAGVGGRAATLAHGGRRRSKRACGSISRKVQSSATYTQARACLRALSHSYCAREHSKSSRRPCRCSPVPPLARAGEADLRSLWPR